MTDLFSPRRPDGRAEWRVIYDNIIKRPYGTEIPFEDFQALLETDDHARVHRAVRRCNQVLTRENIPRVLGNIRGIGYRVLQPGDYAPQALNIQSQARRRMTNAVDLMRAAPLADMTAAQQQWAHQVTMVLIDNELRLRSQEQWKKDAEQRLRELERRAGLAIAPPIIKAELV